MISIKIKKDYINSFNDDISIYINDKDIESNIVLDAKKLTKISDINGFKANEFRKIPIIIFNQRS